MKAIQRVAQFVSVDAFTLHSLLTVILFLIAFVLFMPGDTLNSSPGFAWFASHAPFTDNGWGTLIGICAMIGVFGLATQNRWVSLGSKTVLCFCHLVIAGGMYEANHIGWWNTYLVLALYSMASIFQISVDD